MNDKLNTKKTINLLNKILALETCKELFALEEGKSVLLEENTRRMITEEETHQGEVGKMLRTPRKIAMFTESA